MQVLFIAPVHGKNKPQLTYPYEAIENDNSINNRETLKKNSEFHNRVLDATRGRLENIVRRPKRSGSKVRLSLKGARLYCALSIGVFILFGFRCMQGSDSCIGPKERVLVLGWRPSVVEMIEEYDNYLGPGSVLVDYIPYSILIIFVHDFSRLNGLILRVGYFMTCIWPELKKQPNL